jgi:hypothetical protein
MAPTNAVVDELNATLTERLLAAGRLDAAAEINIAGCVFYPGQPVVTRTNNRTLRYGAGEWVRNGDRWTVNAGTRDELYLTNTVTGDRLALPAEYIAASNVTVNYASTIHRAQGATVEEAHVIIGDRTNSRQLYVAATRGRRANHIHTAPPAFDPDQHGPDSGREDWTPTNAAAANLSRQPDAASAIARRRQLRELVNGPGEQIRGEQNRGEQNNHDDGAAPTGNSSARAGRCRRATPTHEQRAERPVAQPIDNLAREGVIARLCGARPARTGDRLRRYASAGRFVLGRDYELGTSALSPIGKCRYRAGAMRCISEHFRAVLRCCVWRSSPNTALTKGFGNFSVTCVVRH